ncbi:hypothetical protein WJX82_003001 [Trebouxia sp. C0006]
MQSASKLVGSSLSNLVHELSDFLQAQNEESTTTTPYSGSTAIAPRLRTVLLALLNECLDFRTGRERELASILNLVTMAVQKYPSVVCDNKCSAAMAMLQRIIPMFAQEKFRNVHTALLRPVVSLISLLPEGSVPVYAIVCRGVTELAEDAYGALRILEASSLTAAHPTVTISCFQGAEAVSRAEAESGTADAPTLAGPSTTADKDQALCTIQLDSVHACQLLCSMTLELQSHCLRSTPLAILPWTSPEGLTMILDVVVHAGFSLQASALNALAALLPELEFDLIPVHAVSTALLTALDACITTDSIPHDYPAAHIWQRHMLTCLNLLAGVMDGSNSEAGAAESMLTVLSRLACCVPAGHMSLQRPLCRLVLHMAQQHPRVSHHVTGLMPLLSDKGQTGEIVNLAFQVLLSQLPADHLDHTFPSTQADLPAQVASQAQDPYHPKKRRKTQSSQQHASRSAKAQVTISPPLTDQWLQCRDAIVRLVKALSPRQETDSDTGDAQLFKTATEQLQALLNMLVAAKESNGIGLVCALAAVVGQWAQYVLQEHASSAAVTHITDMSIEAVRNYHELPVTGHGGAAVPLKALKAFTDALLFGKQPEVLQGSHLGLHKEIMLQALLTRAETATPEQAEGLQDLLHQGFALSSSSDRDIRVAFAQEAQALAQPVLLKAMYGSQASGSSQPSDVSSYEAKLLQEAKQLLEQGQQQRLDVKETLLETIAVLGQRTHSPSAQLLALAVLVGRLDDLDPGIRSFAAQLLLGYASVRQCDLQDMLLSIPRLKEFVGRNLLAKPNLLGELADLLEMPVPDLALKLIPAALPKLTEDQNTAALEALAHSVGYGLQQMMLDYGFHVVAKYLYGGYARFEAVMTFMESLIGTHFIRYVGTNMQHIIKETIYLAGTSADWQGVQLPETVYEGAQQMLLTLSNIHTLNNIENFANTQGDEVTGDVGDFLAEGDHVTRILKAYGDALKAPEVQQAPTVNKTDISMQQTYLRCVLLLVRLTGQYVARFLPQMMVLLSGALRDSPTGAKLQALEGWLLLLRALAQHAPTHLGGMANQVVVTLLDPLQEGGAVAAAAVTVLEQLVVHAKHLLGERLKTLPPLPQAVEGLGRINAVIAEQRGSLTTEESIRIPLKALGDHSLSVRTTALQDIRNILHHHRAWLGGLLPPNTTADGAAATGQQTELLSSLLGALLKCCDPEIHTPTSWKAQQLCAECLGLLGAVDPARVVVALDPPESLCRSTKDLLIILIMRHLVRLLRVASHIFVLDAAALAIQEVLKHYGTAEEPTSHRSRGSRESTPTETNTLFIELPEEVQNVVRPYLDSKFQLQGGTLLAPGVIIRPDMTFRRWLTSWMRQLTGLHASGELLPMFKACMPVTRCDIQSARFLMPYLLHNVISAGSPESRKGVKDEIVAVLKGAGAHKEGELCVQAIFLLLDVLKKWAEETKGTAAWSASGAPGASSGPTSSAQDVHQLLASIPQDLLAQAAAQCGAHARALLHYETHLRSKEGGGLNPVAHKNIYYSDDEVSFLQEVYGKLEEPDGLAGLLRLRQGPPRLQDQLLAAEKAGSWSEALALHEQALQHSAHLPTRQQGNDPGPMKGGQGLTGGQRGYLRCLLHMGHLQGMMTQVDGWASHSSEVAKEQLAASRMAAAWRLGQWDVLEGTAGHVVDHMDLLDSDERWEVRLGKMLAAVHTRQADVVKVEIAEARSEVMAPLSAASMESYTRAYPYLVKLHMLQELSDAAAVLSEGSLVGPLDRQRRLRWAERLQVTQSSLPTQESILALRRQLAIVPGAGLERAKLLWDMDKPHRAIISLQEILQETEAVGASSSNAPGPSHKRTEAKLVLQLATWMANTGQGAKSDITGLFERAVALDKSWEKGYFSYAVYLDQLMRDARQRQTALTASSRTSAKPMDRLGGRSRIPLGEDQPHLEILPEVIRNYGLAVQYGHRHIFQSLPRLLTLWFDFGSHIKSITVTQKNRQISTAVANIMAAMAKALPSYAWLTALPQLISRICHTNPEVNTVTNHIITHVAEAYPQQALWALAAVQKSLVMGRKQAASAIMNTLKKHCTKPYNRKLYDQFPSLCDQLIRLCNHQPPAKAKSFSAKKDFAALVRSLPLDVMMPVNTGLTLTLPTSGCTERQHQPFAEVVTIADIKDEVELLPSLQKPKKVDLIGSDGRVYRFLAKPKDDLRKDNRMMEVASILNGLFAKDPASRRRNLLIRRFAVIPLTEETGIIEWVPHTHGLRHCCQDIYIADGTYDKRTVNMTVKKIYDGFQGKRKSELLDKLLDMYPPGKRKSELLDKLLAMYPPVLHRWFLARFPEPATWHNARLGFTRTTAVWSMVGHIVGLGDRHGENILLDATTGDAVHVDFAFLFDRGLTLAIPEMVPFRLTQNLVDAFGVSGYKGAFHRACEVTLQVLRMHRDTLLSVLETLVHDPLVEWVPKNAKSGAEEQENAMARDAMATIEGRLTGTLLGVSSMPSLPLSTEGQAHRLIEEATDKNNLGQMYIWWMPWL